MGVTINVLTLTLTAWSRVVGVFFWKWKCNDLSTTRLWCFV